MAVEFADDLNLTAGVIAGDQRAIDRYLDIAATSLWPAVTALVGDGAAAEEAFLGVIEALKANGFARLKKYQGEVRLSRFLILAAREVLGEQTARAFAEAPNQAWRRFDRLFSRDIRRLIQRRFPRADDAQQHDLYQDVAAKLIENDYARIRSYQGHGAFCGYILTVVNRLLIDLQRREAPRRRLPAEVARASPLLQAIFIEVAWRGVAPDPDRILPAVRAAQTPEPTREEVAAALAQLSDAIVAARASEAKPQEISIDGAAGDAVMIQLRADDLTAEEQMIEAERTRRWDALAAAVRREAASLPAEERVYLDILLSASERLSAREIARQMGVPAEEIYRLQQRVQRWMKKIAAELPKTADASV
jgi:RNA polymerase primary sigma factor